VFECLGTVYQESLRQASIKISLCMQQSAEGGKGGVVEGCDGLPHAIEFGAASLSFRMRM
jgi:hypothetical protein